MLAQRCGRGHGVLRRGLGWKGLGGWGMCRSGLGGGKNPGERVGAAYVEESGWLRGLGALRAPTRVGLFAGRRPAR